MAKVNYIGLIVKSITSALSNKYVFTLVAFFLVIGFFGSKSVFSVHRKLDSKLAQIEDEKRYYKEEIVRANKVKEDNFSSIDKLEKFARESHFMKKENEEIIRIIEE